MPRYLLLLRPETLDLASMPAEEKRALFARFVTWSESLKAGGVLRGVESLMDDGGKTVRKKRDRLFVDGPYAEMKELVSGLFVVEVESEQRATELAKGCPLLDEGGVVEVREIADFPVKP